MIVVADENRVASRLETSSVKSFVVIKRSSTRRRRVMLRRRRVARRRDKNDRVYRYRRVA